MSTNLETHEFNKVFPLMGERELDALALSIKELGLLHHITLFEGKILDGKSRYEACKRAGVEPVLVPFSGNRRAALRLLVSENMYRSHYSSDQKAAIVAALEGEAKQQN